MHVLFAGGGTAGHINPALAVAGYIKEKDPNAIISYIGTERGLESRLVRECGYAFYPIDVAGFQRKISPENIKRNISAFFKMFSSFHDSKKLISRLRPDIVVGTGGYVSGPVLRAAAKLGVPTCIHEQNAFPGVTTKALSSMVDRVMLAMPEAESYLKCKNPPVVTGNPVRGSIISTDREKARAAFGLGERKLILSFGGSLGARPINEAVAGLIEHYKNDKNVFIMHAAGKNGYRAMCEDLENRGIDPARLENLRLSEYINDMGECMAAADLIICRAGAITLSEIENCGRASILIPSPYVAENHQLRNAETLASRGAAEIIEEKDLTEESLISVVSALLSDERKPALMGEKARAAAVCDSTERIYSVISELLGQ